MSTNPLDPSPADRAAIHDRARDMWEAAGRPDGGADAFIEQADTLIRMETAGLVGQLENPMAHPEKAPIVEEASIQSNLGEFPGGSGMADQGEWRETPMTREELRHGGDAEPGRGDAP